MARWDTLETLLLNNILKKNNTDTSIKSVQIENGYDLVTYVIQDQEKPECNISDILSVGFITNFEHRFYGSDSVLIQTLNCTMHPDNL